MLGRHHDVPSSGMSLLEGSGAHSPPLLTILLHASLIDEHVTVDPHGDPLKTFELHAECWMRKIVKKYEGLELTRSYCRM